MPRPKGSKNKKAIAFSMEDVESKIAAVQAEIDDLGAQLKAKKAELKTLTKEKAAAEKAAAAKKLEEDKDRIMAAVEKSGMTVDEILELFKKD